MVTETAIQIEPFWGAHKRTCIHMHASNQLDSIQEYPCIYMCIVRCTDKHTGRFAYLQCSSLKLSPLLHTLSKLPTRSSKSISMKAKLVTDDGGISSRPVVITDSAPHSIVLDLHPPLHGGTASHQTHRVTRHASYHVDMDRKKTMSS